MGAGASRTSANNSLSLAKGIDAFKWTMIDHGSKCGELWQLLQPVFGPGATAAEAWPSFEDLVRQAVNNAASTYSVSGWNTKGNSLQNAKK